MDQLTEQALTTDRVIDITTTGRKSGEPRRQEIWFYNFGGDLYITGRPGARDWYANMLANPDLTFHLKESAQADIPARAIPVLEESQRRGIISKVYDKLGKGPEDYEAWVAGSPLVEIKLDPS